MFERALQSFDSMRRELGLQRFVFAGHRCCLPLFMCVVWL